MYASGSSLGVEAIYSPFKSGVGDVSCDGKGKGDATIIDSAILTQRVVDVRVGLPSELRRGGNIAVADIDIPGVSK